MILVISDELPLPQQCGSFLLLSRRPPAAKRADVLKRAAIHDKMSTPPGAKRANVLKRAAIQSEMSTPPAAKRADVLKRAAIHDRLSTPPAAKRADVLKRAVIHDELSTPPIRGALPLTQCDFRANQQGQTMVCEVAYNFSSGLCPNPPFVREAGGQASPVR